MLRPQIRRYAGPLIFDDHTRGIIVAQLRGYFDDRSSFGILCRVIHQHVDGFNQRRFVDIDRGQLIVEP